MMSRTGALVVAVVVCLSLAGCSSSMFGEAVGWEGGTLYNGKLRKQERPESPMSLDLKSDGTGTASNIPRGIPPMDDNVCINLTDERYSGAVKWRRDTDFSFEVEFEDSKYLVLGGKGKFGPDWTETRIYTCTYGLEYWRMPLLCSEPGFTLREVPTCGIAREDLRDRGRKALA